MAKANKQIEGEYDQQVAIDDIRVDNEFNVRQKMEGIDELAESIKATGINTPLGVQKQRGGGVRLVYGFRRLEAAKAAGLTHIPARVFPANQDLSQMMLLNLQENAARQSLSPMEEARGAQRLIDQGIDIDAVTAAMGWSKKLMTERLQLLSYSPALRDAVDATTVTVQQARAISQLPEDRHERFIGLAEANGVQKLRQMVDAELERIVAAESPQLPDDGDDIPRTIDGGDDEDGEAAAPKAAKIDPSVVAAAITTAFADLIFGAHQDNPSQGAESNMEIRRVDLTGLPVDQLERMERVVSNLVEALGFEGMADTVLGESDDA